MSDERLAFSRRLADAMRAKHLAPRPGVLHKLFNSRYHGEPVAFSTASKWLHGKAIPVQDKLQVLATALEVEPQRLRFGETGRVRGGETRASWAMTEAGSTPTPHDRQVIKTFLALPQPRRELVGQLVNALSQAADN